VAGADPAREGEATTAESGHHPGIDAPTTRLTSARWWGLVPLVAAALFTIQALDAARLETPTIDEFAHVPAGYAYLEHGSLELYAKNPPLGRYLLALPGTLRGAATVPVPGVLGQGWGAWRYGQRFMEANAEGYLSLFREARAVVVVLTLLTAALLFHWARSLFGLAGASMSSTLFLLSPTTIAHGHLATVDAACALTILGALVAFRWAWREPTAGRVVAAGAVWGLALLVKYTALLIAPAVAILVLFLRRPNWRAAARELALYGLAALLVVNVGMGFQGSGRRLADHTLASDVGRAVQAALPGWLPVPLPAPYVLGFDAVRIDTERGEYPGYLHGEWSRKGWWYYEGVALLLKSPLVWLLLLVACPWFLRRRGLPRRELAIIVVPLVVVGLMLTVFNRLSYGVRYLLPILPLLHLLIGSIWWRPRTRVASAGALLVLAVSVVTVVGTHPHHLAYFNTLAGGSARGHEWLLDSNLDWGQDLYRVPDALRKLGVEGPIRLLYFGHVDPGLYGIEYELVAEQPTADVQVVSVSYLLGFAYPALDPEGRWVRVGRERARWLRDVEPVARVGSIWIFDTRPSRDAPVP
jgi:hypothetical protein